MNERVFLDDSRKNIVILSAALFIGLYIYNSVIGDISGLLFCLVTYFTAKNPEIARFRLLPFVPLVIYSSLFIDETSIGYELFYIITMLSTSSIPLVNDFYSASASRIIDNLFMIHSTSIFAAFFLIGFDIVLITNLFLALLIYSEHLNEKDNIFTYRESYLSIAAGLVLSSLAIRERLLMPDEISFADYQLLKTIIAIFIGLFLFDESSRLAIEED